MIEEIDPKRAWELIKEGNVIVLDIRTPEEFSPNHVDGAVNIDFYGDDFEEKVTLLDKEKTYVIHCNRGGRCPRAGEIMERVGFKKIYRVKGSMFTS